MKIFWNWGLVLLLLVSMPFAARAETEAPDSNRLLEHVRHLTETIGPRVSGSPEERSAADFVVRTLESYGYQVKQEPFVTGERYVGQETVYLTERSSQNVVAYRPGRSSQYILLGAHLDSAHPSVKGANDNASGLAALLETARLLAGRDQELGIKVVAFGAEEDGLLGSKYFVASDKSLSNCCYMINFDMVGRGKIMAIEGAGTHSSPWWLLQGVWQRGKDLDLPVAIDGGHLLLVRNRLMGGNSDYSPFLDAGVPAVSLGAYGKEDPDYHTPMDDLTKIDGERMGNFVRLAISMVETPLEGGWEEGSYLPFQWGPLALAVPLWSYWLLLLAGILLALWPLRKGFVLFRGDWRKPALIFSGNLLFGVLVWWGYLQGLAALAIPVETFPWIFAVGPVIFTYGVFRRNGLGTASLMGMALGGLFFYSLWQWFVGQPAFAFLTAWFGLGALIGSRAKSLWIRGGILTLALLPWLPILEDLWQGPYGEILWLRAGEAWLWLLGLALFTIIMAIILAPLGGRTKGWGRKEWLLVGGWTAAATVAFILGGGQPAEVVAREEVDADGKHSLVLQSRMPLGAIQVEGRMVETDQIRWQQEIGKILPRVTPELVGRWENNRYKGELRLPELAEIAGIELELIGDESIGELRLNGQEIPLGIKRFQWSTNQRLGEIPLEINGKGPIHAVLRLTRQHPWSQVPVEGEGKYFLRESQWVFSYDL